MTRKKVTLAYIENEAARKATFKKRKKGLMKKVNELSTLCGIESCAIVYSPYDPEPEVWPSALGARRTIARFRNMSEMDQSKRMMNQVGFIKQRISKAHDQLKKQLRENREREVTGIMHRALLGHGLGGLNLLDLNDLGWLVDKNLREIDERIKSLMKNPNPNPDVPSKDVAPAADNNSKAKVEVGESSGVPGNTSALASESGPSQEPWTMYMEMFKPNENVADDVVGGDGNFGRITDDMAAPSYFLPNQGLPWSNNFHLP
ncbi:hypothetical protein MLD38_037418 [Melastoma candidum]|uniref:Uncharacterized protein n=1 Tax=Melastoma candidum TaxID=119954 RepID=A0ACB9LN81_9MYRT|nr:hypothetical protein MLD38_037418 [Melastoma candidum]